MRFLKISLLPVLLSAVWACSAQAEPQDYVLDGSHTHIVWKVERFGFTNTVATFADIQGTLILDEDNPEASSVNATIAVSSVRSDLFEREDAIRHDVWLGADTHPTIKFTSTQVELLPDVEGRQAAKVTGDLTLKGVTLPVTLDVVLNKIGTEPPSRKKAMGFSATGHLERDDFGITTALKFIGNDVSFEIEALAVLADAD